MKLSEVCHGKETRMQIKLGENSRLDIIPIERGAVSLRLYQAGSDRFGHGWLLRAVTQLKGEQLEALQAAMTPAEENEAA